MLRKIKFKEFKDLYRKHIIKDFPKNERPNLEGFRKRMLKNNEEVYIFEEDGIDKGYCIIHQLKEYILVAFLAVYKENRGKGTGTKILKEIQEKYSNKKGILLEVEDPDFAKNNKEKNIQEKRIKFYEKSNFKIVKNLKEKLYTVNLKIMVYEFKKTDVKEIENTIKEFYYTVIDKKMQKYIIIKNDLEDEEKKQKGNE